MTIFLELSSEKFGDLPHRCSSNRESVISDISSVRKYCAKDKERLTSNNPHFIKSIFSKGSHTEKEKISKQDVKFLLENTLDKLHKSQSLSSRNEISPRVDTTSIVKSSTRINTLSNPDKTPEI